jgi:hypothetical protein
MNFGKGGQNIVQAGSNNPNVFRNAGGLLNKFLGRKLDREERDYNRGQDEESRIRVNKAQTMDRAGAEVFKALVLPGAAAYGATKAYSIANETLGKDHPDVIAGTKPATTLKHPEMAHQVNNYGFDVGYRPAKTPPSKVQADARADMLRGGEENTRQSGGSSGTVARFGKDGKITREPVSLENIEYGEKTSERAPDFLNDDAFDSTSPTDRAQIKPFTPEEKADLEKERPRTGNLNTGINEGKGGNK